MSINYNGASATDGLVFAYDLGNIRSYKGVPSKNVARPLTQWPTKARATITEVTDNSVEPPFKGAQVFKVVCNSDTNSTLIRDGAYYYRHPWNNLNSGHNQGLLADQENQITSVGQNKYRYVVYAKRTPNSNPNAAVSIDIGDRNVVNSGVLGDDWVRIETNDAQGINAAYYPYDFFDIVLSPTEIGNEVYISAVMIITSPNDTFETLTTPPASPQYLDYGEERGYDESLLDIIGGAPIDLTNVSFDSNAQMIFDGTDDKIEIPNHSPIIPGTSDFTLEMVVKSNTANRMWFVSGYNLGGNGYYAIGSQNGYFIYDMKNSSGQRQENGGFSPIISNQPYHIIATRTPSGLKIYVNGILQVDNPSVGLYDMNEPTIRFGTEYGIRQYLNGSIYHYKHYTKALTAEEVAQNFNLLKNRFDL